MPLWKQLLLTLYYHGSYPLRWWDLRSAMAADRVAVAVLFYHRIADDRANEWTTSNRMFARQIRWLKSRFELISLAEAQRRIARRSNHRPAVSITFDDGYADNCQAAVPLLVKQRIPCTYFVTLGNVLSGEPFPHDAAMGNRLRPNTVEQVCAMARAGIEIGAHTRSHPDLGTITDRKRLWDEVVTAGRKLQGLVGRPVRYFAFPFGQPTNLSRQAFRIAAEAGYDGVCSACGGLNYPGDDPFHLRRIGVDDNLIGLKNEVTGDPRKRHAPRFEYAEPQQPESRLQPTPKPH